MFTGPTLLDRSIQTLVSYANQIQPFAAHISYRNRSRRIPYKATERHATIYRKYIAFLKPVSRGEAVDHLFINRSANGIRKAVITLECRQRARVANHLLGHSINLNGSDPGLHHVSKPLQNQQ